MTDIAERHPGLGEHTERDAGLVDKWSESLFEDDNLARLTEAEIERVFDGKEAPEGVKAVIIEASGDNKASTLGRAVEKSVFFEFFGNDLDLMRDEYTQYDSSSTFLIALDVAQKRPVGVVRFIKDSPVGQKSLVDVASPEHPWKIGLGDLMSRTGGVDLDPATSLDVATLAIAKDYRAEHAADTDFQKESPDTENLSAHLYYAMYQWTRNNGYENWFGILDTTPLQKIQHLNNPLNTFEGVEPGPYLDSESSVPFFANMDQIDERTAAAGIDGFFLRGEGLDPAIKVEQSITD